MGRVSMSHLREAQLEGFHVDLQVNSLIAKL